MRNLVKFTSTLLLFCLFLIICFIITVSGYTALLLRTYSVFTQREEVAKVTISERKEDSLGQYADVYIKIKKSENTAFGQLFGIASSPTPEVNFDEYSFKIYGDTVHVSGPVIKFRNELIFVNFKTIFKMSQVYVSDNYDNDAEEKRHAETSSEFSINGGISDGKSIFEIY